MKLKIRGLYWVFGIVAIILISCQKEESETIDPFEDGIPRNSQLAKVMQNVVTHDGSYDDIVDKGNCYSIKLPYSILHNGEELVIDDQSDYEKISTTDDIQIQFPVTITMHNYVENQIRHITELENFSRTCHIQDEDIECVDFVYPIKLSLFNPATNIFTSREIGHDRQLFNFMSDVAEDVLISIRYPITLKLYNGVNVGATHNTELLGKILAAASTCDENDR